MNKRHPNRQLVDKWEPKQRIKHKSFLHHVNKIKDNYHLPTNRLDIFRISKSLKPHTNYLTLEIKLTLIDNVTKKADQFVITDASLRTIDNYPKERIRVYTDGSALKATVKAGYGVYIEYPDKTHEELFNACGDICSNFEAEIAAIEAALYHLKTRFDETPTKSHNIVIFSN
jgi:ribonuclease HI